MRARKIVKPGAVFIVLALFLGCAGVSTIQGRTETMVIGYESISLVAFPSVKAYLAQREANGSLSGDALVSAKATYAKAKKKFLQVGDSMIQVVNGTGTPLSPSAVASLLQEVAVLLANLSGGSVQGNTLTVGKAVTP